MFECFNFYSQELTIRQEISDLKGECKAHGHLGAVHMSLGNYTNAMKCYEEQLERAKELKVGNLYVNLFRKSDSCDVSVLMLVYVLYFKILFPHNYISVTNNQIFKKVTAKEFWVSNNA